ncbi:MAG: TrkA family potassium uptake protein [Candidatus Eiseniibacteriota bacterium]|jgi:trk system potassium uptake protein TrkA
MGQYAVLGLGEFGMSVARTLIELRQQVLCVDSDETLIQQAAQIATRAVVADVSDREALAELALKDMDAVVLAVGRSLEASVLATLYLREMQIERIIAKATREDHARILKSLGVEDIVLPEVEVGRKVAQKIVHPNLVDYFPLQPDVSVREMAPPPSFLGQKLESIDALRRWGIKLLAIRDDSRGKIEMLPPPGLVLEGKDRLVLLGRDEDLDRLGKLE